MANFVTIYRKKQYRIYSSHKGAYIVHNSDLEFSEHHTHINNYNTAKFIIDLCIHKTIPHHLSDYLLVSILRLSNDRKYKMMIERKLEQNKSKKGNNKNE